jgi:trans-aconitate methyltransferase
MTSMSIDGAFAWQAGTERADRPFLGEIADAYQDIRPAYGPELVDQVLTYAGHPIRAVEVGAGTGKATDGFAGRGVQVDCIEPDPAMADVLARRFEGTSVRVRRAAFEDWRPTELVPLVYSAQAWHWVDPNIRCKAAYDALVPGGALALFGHRYLLEDRDVEDVLDRVYLDQAPHLLGDPRTREVAPSEYWYTTELANSGLFIDVDAAFFDTVVTYDVDAYLALVATFSSHRQLTEEQLRRLVTGLREALSSVGTVRVQLGTVLALARKPSDSVR